MQTTISAEVKLSVGSALLKLCRHNAIDTQLPATHWIALAALTQDDDDAVHIGFTELLMKDLSRTLLPVKFLALPTLTLSHANA